METIVTEKRCTKCGEVKLVSEFYKKPDGKYGVRGDCKLCTDAQHKEWNQAHKEQLRLSRNKYTAENRERMRELGRLSYWNNVDERRKYGREKAARLRRETIENYGGKCECCGESRIEFLAIDHLNGGGNQERKRLKNKGGCVFYQYLKNNKYPAGYRVLCHNCNMSLGMYGYCPHQKEKGVF